MEEETLVTRDLTLKERLTCWWLTRLAWVVLAFRLKTIWTWFSRIVFEWGTRYPVGNYAEPARIERELARCRWKSDPFSGKWDYISSPEAIMWRIKHGGENPLIGDCDDFHFFAAYVLAQMPDVEDVQLLSTMYCGAAHATTVFTFIPTGKKYQFDYRIREIREYEDAPHIIAKRYSKCKPDENYIKVATFQKVEKGNKYPGKPFKIMSGAIDYNRTEF